MDASPERSLKASGSAQGPFTALMQDKGSLALTQEETPREFGAGEETISPDTVATYVRTIMYPF